MIDRLHAAWLAGLVEARLATLEREVQITLRLHYSPGKSFPFEVSRAAISDGKGWAPELLIAWLRDASEADRKALAERTASRVQAAQDAYNAACRTVRVRREVWAR